MCLGVKNSLQIFVDKCQQNKSELKCKIYIHKVNLIKANDEIHLRIEQAKKVARTVLV